MTIFLTAFSVLSFAATTLTIYAPTSFARVIEDSIQEEFENTHNCKLIFLTAQGTDHIIHEIGDAPRPRGDMFVGLSYDAVIHSTLIKHLAPLEHAFTNIQETNLPMKWTEPNLLPLQLNFVSFIYDADIVTNPPKNFHDLANTPYKIIISDPRTSVTGFSLLLWVKNAYGQQAPEIWKALKEKILTVTSSWSEAYSLFLRQEAPIALSYTGSTLRTNPEYKHINLKASAFEEGQYLEILVGGILNISPKKELANALLEELIRPETQYILANRYLGYPAIKLPNLPAEFSIFPELTPTHKPYSKQEALEEWLEALS